MVQLTRRSLNATLAVIALSSDGLLAVASSRAQPLPAGPASGVRDPGAEQFVQTRGRRLMSILGDSSLDEAQKAAAYRRALEQTADLRGISDFLLGKYSATISAEQRDRFTDAFLGYARRVSVVWLKPYREDRFRVRGSHVIGPGDVIVDIEISGSASCRPETCPCELREAAKTEGSSIWSTRAPGCEPSDEMSSSRRSTRRTGISRC